MSLTGLFFVLLFLASCVLAFARHPIFGLAGYVATFYLHPPTKWWGVGWMQSVRWSLLIACVTLVAVLLHRRTVPAKPFFQSSVVLGLGAFVGWLLLQSLWAMNQEKHADLIELFAKYLIVVFLIVRCIENEQHLKVFLWTHVLGCAYLGYIAVTSYKGGRFEGFGGPGLGDANAAANQIVSGVVVAGALLLSGSFKERIGLVGVIPFIMNALVTTMSRSGFLALAVGGFIFNLFAPARFRMLVRVLSVLGVVLLLLVTNKSYWERIDTIKYQGEDIEGVDTGGGRLEIIEAQWRMFKGHVMGCGHRCTEVLAPAYLESRFLTSAEGSRSSHNTVMTLLVEQGAVGVIVYLAMLWWVFKNVISLRRACLERGGLFASLYPAVAGSLAAIVVGDMFVDFLKHEARIWFIGVILVMQRMVEPAVAQEPKVRPGGRNAGRSMSV